MRKSTRRLWNTVARCPMDQTIGRSVDVHRTSIIHVLNSTHKHIKLTLTGCSRLYGEW